MSRRIPHYQNATTAWLKTIEYILENGSEVKARGSDTIEVLDNCFSFDMSDPIVVNTHRKLNYKFMAAEAEWITRGSNKLEDLTKYNSNMAKFSDDGVILSGAYGLPYMNQFDNVLLALVKDEYTRQAAMTIWQSNPRDSKDIPCTVAMVFNIRDGYFNSHVFMRSSDAWLGLPYDMFSFAMMALKILSAYNGITGYNVKLGKMHLKLVSSHLYAIHTESALQAAENVISKECDYRPMNKDYYSNWDAMQNHLLDFMEEPHSSFTLLSI